MRGAKTPWRGDSSSEPPELTSARLGRRSRYGANSAPAPEAGAGADGAEGSREPAGACAGMGAGTGADWAGEVGATVPAVAFIGSQSWTPRPSP